MRKVLSVFLFLGLTLSLEAKLPKTFSEDLPSDYFQFWFLYESEKRGAQNGFWIRPLYGSWQDPSTAYRFKTILSPIFFKEETNHWYSWSSLFFFTGTGFKHEEGDDEEDIFLSPIFFWGKGDTPKEEYISIYPFYGTMRNKISYQKIRFFGYPLLLFPLYSEWSYKTYEAKSILWPLTLSGKSETRDEFRIFPFYSHKEHLGKYKRYSILWPFFQWGEDRMDKREPTQYKVFFPFYLSKDTESGSMKSRAFLWFPILNSLFSYGFDKKTKQKNLSFLFFFFQFTSSEKKDTEKFVIFPLYGYSYFANKEAEFITPFYISLSQNTNHLKAKSYFVFPIFSHMKQEYPGTGRDDLYWKVWPIVRYHKDSEGNTSWNTVSLIPVRFESMEDMWEPIFSIIEYKKLVNGEKRLHLISRLYTQRWTESEFNLHIPLLAEYKKSEKGFKYDFLYGFLGIDTQKEKNTFKLIWLIEI
ncbi:hypothetical protein [Leptospira ryugenii]|uniref:hypothetical protein n=1 Tax=Leptospira ryugenii TaxID=1917863 RepID=UPI000D58CC78|nr:hypothetical protein [Leptospira ryugenii]